MVAAGKQVHAKPNTPIFPDRFDICRNVVFLDPRTIMESSGEPVSKYRVKVEFRGVRNISCFQERRPTWDTAHSFSINNVEGGKWRGFDPQLICCRSLPISSRSNCSRVKARADCPFGRFLVPTWYAWWRNELATFCGSAKRSATCSVSTWFGLLNHFARRRPEACGRLPRRLWNDPSEIPAARTLSSNEGGAR